MLHWALLFESHINVQLSALAAAPPPTSLLDLRQQSVVSALPLKQAHCSSELAINISKVSNKLSEWLQHAQWLTGIVHLVQ